MWILVGKPSFGDGSRPRPAAVLPSVWEAHMADHVVWETIKARGAQVVDELRRLLHEGNVRRVVVEQEGRVIAEFPLTVGLVGALAAPVLAAIGALVAVLADCTIAVERAAAAQRSAGPKPGARARKARKAARPAGPARGTRRRTPRA
jgi:hypothetical protein